MAKQEYDKLTDLIIQSFKAMKEKGHWMDSGEIELNDGTKFTYKIKEKTK